MLKATVLLTISLPLSALSVAAQNPQATTAQGFNAINAWPDIDYINLRPMPPNAYRVLFIGDSLTYHTQNPKLWDHVSGMAATSADKDFVHLATTHIQSRIPDKPVEIMIDNGGNGRIGPMLDYLKSHPTLQPSLVVLQGGENDKLDDTFKDTYKSLLDFYTSQHIPIIVLSDWWDDDKRDFEAKEVAARHYAWVDIRTIDKDPACSGYGGPHNVEGVARHPNDDGQRQIALAIDKQFDKLAPASHKVK